MIGVVIPQDMANSTFINIPCPDASMLDIVSATCSSRRVWLFIIRVRNPSVMISR